MSDEFCFATMGALKTELTLDAMMEIESMGFPLQLCSEHSDRACDCPYIGNQRRERLGLRDQLKVMDMANKFHQLTAERSRLRESLEAITKAAKAMGMNEKACLILFDAEKTLEEVL